MQLVRARSASFLVSQPVQCLLHHEEASSLPTSDACPFQLRIAILSLSLDGTTRCMQLALDHHPDHLSRNRPFRTNQVGQRGTCNPLPKKIKCELSRSCFICSSICSAYEKIILACSQAATIVSHRLWTNLHWLRFCHGVAGLFAGSRGLDDFGQRFQFLFIHTRLGLLQPVRQWPAVTGAACGSVSFSKTLSVGRLCFCIATQVGRHPRAGLRAAGFRRGPLGFFHHFEKVAFQILRRIVHAHLRQCRHVPAHESSSTLLHCLARQAPAS